MGCFAAGLGKLLAYRLWQASLAAYAGLADGLVGPGLAAKLERFCPGTVGPFRRSFGSATGIKTL